MRDLPPPPPGHQRCKACGGLGYTARKPPAPLATLLAARAGLSRYYGFPGYTPGVKLRPIPQDVFGAVLAAAARRPRPPHPMTVWRWLHGKAQVPDDIVRAAEGLRLWFAKRDGSCVSARIPGVKPLRPPPVARLPAVAAARDHALEQDRRARLYRKKHPLPTPEQEPEQ